jgi:hypothetical protein
MNMTKKQSKEEKKRIMDARGGELIDEEEWARLQGMTHSELRRGSNVGSFLDEWEEKYKK